MWVEFSRFRAYWSAKTMNRYIKRMFSLTLICTFLFGMSIVPNASFLDSPPSMMDDLAVDDDVPVLDESPQAAGISPIPDTIELSESTARWIYAERTTTGN